MRKRTWQINILFKLHELYVGKHDCEVETLGQLVVNLTRELLETNRNVMELEKRASELEANHNVQELERRVSELEKKQPEPAKA